ncbi:MAG: conjugative transposon protein TraN [Hoylesella enoeca]|uniref:conjugative transposon protein TraN n=1 Tax=Prevotellaceae TaxID=171552 RepID=UPI00027A4E18|nr:MULTISPECIES: conjugative transposon protein TraN [Prevotellaceae]EJP28033.1 conjugative transposon TraN protein [Prevotella sp. MSX73]
MRKILFICAALSAFSISASAQKKYREILPDTAKVRYVRHPKPEDSYFFDSNRRKNTIFVNEEVTTHILMPENIRLVDISTNKIIGNQCTDNIVRIKPAGRMYDNELAGTVTVIGERHIVQYNVVYTTGPARANSIYTVAQAEMDRYENPSVAMPQREMAAYAWAIFSMRPKFHNIHSKAYGIKAMVNNIYSIGDYFFIDYSLYNLTKVKYDISEVRVMLTDKKELKATNAQTIELSPVFALNSSKNFQKAYRNVLVLDKLTFPDEKVMKIEVAENQISGRVITLDINYKDILHADGFDEKLTRYLP